VAIEGDEAYVGRPSYRGNQVGGVQPDPKGLDLYRPWSGWILGVQEKIAYHRLELVESGWNSTPCNPGSGAFISQILGAL
jgi:hypothetical protein